MTNYRPDVKSGLFNATGSFYGAPVSLVGKAAVTDVNATIVAVNVLLRLPLAVSEEFPNGRMYPYVGGGTGIQHTINGPEDKETNDLAFQGLACPADLHDHRAGADNGLHRQPCGSWVGRSFLTVGSAA